MKNLLLVLFMLLILKITAQEQETYIITVYNAVANQCNEDYLTTADGSKIDIHSLENGTLKWCAVSRDMLGPGKFKYGDKIEIIHSDTLIAGIYEIHDTTSPRFKKHIDILMPNKIRTGKWTCKIKKP